MTVEEQTETGRVKRSLRRLAGPDDRQLIDRAMRSLDEEIEEEAATFVETVGIDSLESAVESTTEQELKTRGQRALAVFRRFQNAAAGESAADHFHCGHGTDLRGDDEPSTQ